MVSPGKCSMKIIPICRIIISLLLKKTMRRIYGSGHWPGSIKPISKRQGFKRAKDMLKKKMSPAQE